MSLFLIACMVFLILPTDLLADTIYVIASPAHEDSTDVPEEPTAFAQSIEVKRLAARYETTEDVLKQAAGSHVRSMGGLGSYATISLRGSGSNQCLVLLDGQRLNSPSGGGVDLSKIPLSEVERIDIIRGSDSALFGEGSMGGIVNIVTKIPEDHFQADLAATGGSYGTREIRGTMSSPCSDKLGIALTLSERSAENDYAFENNNGTENDPSDDFMDKRRNNAFEDTSYLAKVTVMLNDWDLKLSANGSNAQKEMPGIITFPTPRARQDFSLRNYNLATGGKLGKIALNMDFGRVDQSDTYRDPDAGLYSDTKTQSDQLAFDIGYPLGPVRIKPGFSYLDESMHDNFVGHRRRITRSGLVTFDLNRVPFEFVSTLRYDDGSQFGSQWTYRAGVSYYVTDWLRFKANAGTGYRVPSFYELYYNHGFIVGNQTLQPEQSFSWDIGPAIEHKRFGISLNYFDHHYDDLIAYVLQSGLYYRPYNISRSVSQGVELYAWVEPLDCLKISGNYTYNRALDKSGEPNRDGNQIPGQPRNIANLQIDLNREVKGLMLGFYAAYNYAEGNFITWANTKKLDDRRIVSLGLSGAAGKKISLNLEVKNALDEYVMDMRGFPLEGRAYYITARTAF